MQRTEIQTKKGLTKIGLIVSGMTCEHCAVTIEKLVKRNKGIENADFNFKEGMGEVEFDPALITKMK